MIEYDERHAGMLVVPPSAPFRLSMPYLDTLARDDDAERAKNSDVNISPTAVTASGPNLRRAPSTRSSLGIRGWLASEKTSHK